MLSENVLLKGDGPKWSAIRSTTLRSEAMGQFKLSPRQFREFEISVCVLNVLH